MIFSKTFYFDLLAFFVLFKSSVKFAFFILNNCHIHVNVSKIDIIFSLRIYVDLLASFVLFKSSIKFTFFLLHNCNKVRRGDTRTIEIQLGLGSYVATCVDTRRFKLGDEQVTYKNRNLRARATRVTSKIVIYKPALRTIILHSRGRLHTVKIFGH